MCVKRWGKQGEDRFVWAIILKETPVKRKDTVPNEKKKCLTLILLTWRIWRVPNNASKWQMGFNSAFKGLMTYLLTYSMMQSPS